MPRAMDFGLIRMAALLLDTILVGFAMSFGQHPAHPFGDFHIVVLAIYGAVMWKLRGTTVTTVCVIEVRRNRWESSDLSPRFGGCRIDCVFDLHVVRLDGRPVDWETAIMRRALGCFLSLAVVGLGFIWIALATSAMAITKPGTTRLPARWWCAHGGTARRWCKRDYSRMSQSPEAMYVRAALALQGYVFDATRKLPRSCCNSRASRPSRRPSWIAPMPFASQAAAVFRP